MVPPSPSVTTTRLISSGVNLSTTTLMDGMGHVVQSQVTTAPDGTDYVDTSYDGMGRVFTVSNPHRSATLPTYGTTTNTYGGDERNRITGNPKLEWMSRRLATSAPNPNRFGIVRDGRHKQSVENGKSQTNHLQIR